MYWKEADGPFKIFPNFIKTIPLLKLTIDTLTTTKLWHYVFILMRQYYIRSFVCHVKGYITEWTFLTVSSNTNTCPSTWTVCEHRALMIQTFKHRAHLSSSNCSPALCRPKRSPSQILWRTGHRRISLISHCLASLPFVHWIFSATDH